MSVTQLYPSLLIPLPSCPSKTLLSYLSHPHTVLTKGTLPISPPTASILVASFNALPRPRSRMSAGAVALCKHFERKGSSEHGISHPYWPLPKGSNEEKDETARRALERLLGTVVWRNVLWLHDGVAIYEAREGRGFGMRWTLELEVEDSDKESGREGDVISREVGEIDDNTVEIDGENNANKPRTDWLNNTKNWKIVNTTFRGFVEPIEGLDHEVLQLSD